MLCVRSLRSLVPQCVKGPSFENVSRRKADSRMFSSALPPSYVQTVDCSAKQSSKEAKENTSPAEGLRRIRMQSGTNRTESTAMTASRLQSKRTKKGLQGWNQHSIAQQAMDKPIVAGCCAYSVPRKLAKGQGAASRETSVPSAIHATAVALQSDTEISGTIVSQPLHD